MRNVFLKFTGVTFKTKLLLSYVLLISIPLTVGSVLIYKQFMLSYKESSATMIEQRIGQEVNSINDSLNTVEKVAYLLSTNLSLTSFLNEEYNPSSMDSFNNLTNRILPMFTWVRNANPSIVKINILTYNNSISEVDMFIHAQKYEGEDWFREIKNNVRLDKLFWEGYHSQRSYREITTADAGAAVYSLYCMVNPLYQKNSTYLELQVKPSYLYGSLGLSPVGKSGFLAAVDGSRRVISEKAPPVLNAFLRDSDFLSGMEQVKGKTSYQFENVEYSIAFEKIERLNACLISVVPSTEVKELFDKSRQSYLYIYGTTLLFLLLLAYYLGNLLTKKVSKITRAFQQFQKGDFETRISVKGSDELDKLSVDFNTMAANIRELVNKVYKAEIAQKQAELAALQAQIKPHFIYNTLESLKMTAELHDEEEISDSLTALGNLIRQNTYTENHLIPIGAELENLTDYIKIQNLLHNNKIRTRIDVPEELGQDLILNLVLQPLVENCIKHGLGEERESLEITVGAREKNGCIYFCVGDDGRGIGERKLDVLRQQLGRAVDALSGHAGGNGIGLLNVNRRIKLYFGDEYGLQIKSAPEQGTVATVKIPALACQKGETDEIPTAGG